ncbi:MAG: pilin [Patescibacteria group bacterium]
MLKLWHILAVWFLTTPVLVWANNHEDESQVPPNEVIADPINAGSVQEIADRIINFLLLLAAPIAVVMTIYAGYLFMTARDNQDQVKKARTTLLYVIIGVIILVLSKAVVSFAVSFLTD